MFEYLDCPVPALVGIHHLPFEFEAGDGATQFVILNIDSQKYVRAHEIPGMHPYMLAGNRFFNFACFVCVHIYMCAEHTTDIYI